MAVNGDSMVFGYTNLDYFRWTLSESNHNRRVEKTKDEIETLGFHQMIHGVTRTWSSQPNSLIDQCCTPQTNIFKNIVRSFSYHNLLLVYFRTKNKIENKHNILRREKKNFDDIKYKKDIAAIDWNPFYDSDDLDFLNNFFVTNVLNILDVAAPVKSYQRRKNYRNWVSDEMIAEMKIRDSLRETARVTGSQQDWILYIQARNQCIKKLKECKKLFQQVEEKKQLQRISIDWLVS